ncbi:MAG: hypothetical protein IJ846_04020 [Alphaproteobacteria bacterium]|nr:hypothetical protein [Alphaproteobacteria bacterium]
MEIVHVKHSYHKKVKTEEREALVGSSATRKLLRAYLENAIVLTKGKSKSEAKHALEDYFEKADKKDLLEAPDALDVVKAKEKRLKDKAANASLKTKVNYASDADIGNVSDVVAGGMAAVATVTVAPIVANDPNTLGATLFVATTAYMAAKAGKLMAAEMSASKTPEEKKSARDYANVKHAQLALKMLKKEIEAPIKAAEKAKRKEEVAQLFAAGYGQPSGGLVQAAMLNKQKAGR